LERQLEAKIDVNVDVALHPERMRVRLLDAVAASVWNVRVGDELDAELLQARLPNPASALAVVSGRLVEVENAAAAIGQVIKIRIIDIDGDGTILAEPRTLLPEVPEKKRRRRRGGRGQGKEISQVEQDEDLLELAEEAAKGLGARPPLGISTGSEPDVEEAEARAKAAAQRGVVHVLHPASEDTLDAASGEEGTIRRRRRRRRRRGRGQGGEAPAGIPLHSVEAQAAPEALEKPAEPAVSVPLAAASYVGNTNDEGVGHRRRRRRRRRGRGQVVLTPESQSVPERHIFRATSDGSVEATGVTAPPEPSRAIAPIRHEPAAVAVEPPPPSLTLAPEPPKIPRLTRRRRTEAVSGTLALPAPVELPAVAPIAVSEPIVEPAAETPKRRRSTRKSEESTEAEAKPKRTTRRVATAVKPAAKTSAAASSGAKKKTAAKKTPARKVSTRKKKA
jgi:hypothetical protein